MQESILAYLGVGSNLGDPLENCRESIRRISGLTGIIVERASSFYRTEPVILKPDGEEGRKLVENQDWYINAALEIRTRFSPQELLGALKDIEKLMGRVRNFKGGPRVIDLDLLLYGQVIISESDLIVPHPEMHKRLFVLEPLCEIASYAVHPAFGVSMRGLKERLSESKKVERIEI